MGLVIPLMARGGLILISGLMAQYQVKPAEGRDNLPALLEAIMGNGVRIQSFTQYGQDALRPGFEAEVAKLAAEGALDVPLHVEQGIARVPHALCGLFEKGVVGKVVVQIAEPSAGADAAGKVLQESE